MTTSMPDSINSRAFADLLGAFTGIYSGTSAMA
jgi:hypothetical protein